ncbi:hypothetical protein HCU74_04795 [Spongiibacter sp. KMU-166]|uniref:Cytochrome c-552/4 domain-containing protein n=1 Tax=Spongiibacter thalassae TaxID=2721624 RepID=A0ABX1GEB7_9GAMM|nr:multiheme c-type cytochrome [Spongiibacter thalassae]NKI16737.1 hypothetical protein [Spongiibacter thalassae]
MTFDRCKHLLMIALAAFLVIGMVNAESCDGCHGGEVSSWGQSHHARSMLPALPENIAGKFDGSVTYYNERAFRFDLQDEQYQVWVGEGDNATSYPIDYVFGFNPLQQYLARLPGGRYQAIPVAWDTRPKEQGGQRWFALESDLNWDHPGFTWNTSCAECHSTNLEKGYRQDTDTFLTSFGEVNVGCAACHGSAEGHQQWLASGRPLTPHAGFSVSLAEGGQWQWLDGETIAERLRKPAGRQLSTCAQCHSLRQNIGGWHPDTQMFDHLMLTLPNPPRYHADGQVREEVFVMGSFLQSRMHEGGVVCSSCHEPHSGELRAAGDGTCLQCHRADTYAATEHHRHRLADVQCVDCHMPATVYMGVDARRDHRFGVPDPVLSRAVGSPDPCLSCHGDIPIDRLQQRLPEKVTSGQQRARDFARIQQEGFTGVDHSRLDDGYFPLLREASLLHLLSPALAADRALLSDRLNHPSPVIRAAAIRAFNSVPLSERWRLLSPLLSDPSRAVRMELAPVLAGAAPDVTTEAKAQQLADLFRNYEAQMESNLDSPQITANFANYYMAKGNRQRARDLFMHAVKLDPGFVYPYIQLSALASETPQELEWLNRGKAYDNSGGVSYQLALFHVRQRDYDKALIELEQAVAATPEQVTYSYAYAIALENTGHVEKAIAVLAQLDALGAATTETRDLQFRYLFKSGKKTEAIAFIKEWLEKEPQNPVAVAWRRQVDSWVKPAER